MRKMRTGALLPLMLAAVLLTGCGGSTGDAAQEGTITLSDDGVTLEGLAETGVTLDHDIIYYEDRDTYDSGNPYGEGTAEERHSGEEAGAHTVVHIHEPGTYRVTGTLSRGQIAVDLGEDAKTDPDAVVTLLLDGVDLTCTVAPAIIFYRVYECDTAWVAHDEEGADYTARTDPDTSAAGANLVLADGSVNRVSGSHVARVYEDDDSGDKRYKYDGAVYSCMSLNVDGETQGTGALEILADNEGLDTELHLTLNGGTVDIRSGNDGINTNEDNVSVTTVNGGTLHITAGLGAEGDGVDSNGYLVINGGTVIALANPAADSGLDSILGSYINGGRVLALGSTMDWAESDSGQVTMNLQFASARGADEAIVITDEGDTPLFAYDPDRDESAGDSSRVYQGAIVSCPELEVGATCHVYVGGDLAGTQQNGLYDPATVTDFSGSVRQQYTGTEVGFGPGGFFPGGGPDGERPARPFDGEQPPEIPDGETPVRPFDGERPTEPPDGEPPAMPQDGQRPQRPEGAAPGAGTQALPGSPDFLLSDMVNAFSGVSDETA